MILNLNAQIIWVFVDLLILFVLMKKFLFGPITRMLDDRAQEVSDTLDQADRRLAEAEQQQTAHAAQLASAKAAPAHAVSRNTTAWSRRLAPPCSVWRSSRRSAVNPSGYRCSARRKRSSRLSFC